MSCRQRPEYRASHHRYLVKWRNLKWPQVGDFGWPSGAPARSTSFNLSNIGSDIDSSSFAANRRNAELGLTTLCRKERGCRSAYYPSRQ